MNLKTCSTEEMILTLLDKLVFFLESENQDVAKQRFEEFKSFKEEVATRVVSKRS